MYWSVEVFVDPKENTSAANQETQEKHKQNSQESFHPLGSREKRSIQLTQNARGLLPAADKVPQDNRRGFAVDKGGYLCRLITALPQYLLCFPRCQTFV